MIKLIVGLILFPILCFCQGNNYSNQSIKNIETYNAEVSYFSSDLYKINQSNYYIETKKCFKMGASRKVKIKTWTSKNGGGEKEICFLSKLKDGYYDCYQIISVYKEIDNNNIFHLSKAGKLKTPFPLLEKVPFNMSIMK